MGHCINGFIAEPEVLSVLMAGTTKGVCIDLSQGYQFLPLTDELIDEIEEIGGKIQQEAVEPFWKMTCVVAEKAEQASGHGVLAYIETEYFGGVGDQVAIAWKQGKILSGPFLTETQRGGESITKSFSRFVQRCRRTFGPSPAPASETAINACLVALGVRKGIYSDEFMAIGLHKNRNNDDWIEEGLRGKT